MRFNDLRLHAALAALLIGSALVLADGGGVVTNRVPTVETFSAAASEVDAGGTVILSGTVKDRNKESDIVAIKVETVAGPPLTLTRAVMAADVEQTSEPAFSSGWKVWNSGGTADGVLSFAVETTLTEAGLHTFRAFVQDEDEYQSGPAGDVAVEAHVVLTVAADPVLADGSTATDARWGAWSAMPGATDTTGENYLKITNSGTVADQGITVDFSTSAFTGVEAPEETVPINGNIRFAWWEGAPGATPADGTFTFGDTSPSGSMSAAFTATGNVIFIQYRLDDIPDPAADIAYQAAFTVDPT